MWRNSKIWTPISSKRWASTSSRNFSTNSVLESTNSRISEDSEAVLPEEAKVVICGGGVMGAAVAYHLALMGLGARTVVVESCRIGGGSTWHASGLVGAFKPTLAQVQLAQDSIALYKELESKGLSTGWKQCGSLSLARTRDRMTTFRRMKAQSVSRKIECYLVTPQEARKLCPVLRIDDLVGGIWIPGDGVADPYKTCLTFMSEAQKKGVRIYENCKVTKIVTREDRVTAVDTTRGRIECEHFVNGAGFWARNVGKLSEPYVKVPLYPVEHYYLHTKNFEGLDPMTPVIRDPDGYIYFRENEGKLIAGGFEPVAKPAFDDGKIPENIGERNLPPDWDQFHVLLEQMLHRIPSLGDVRLERLCNGPEAFSPDCKWIVGEAPEIRNYYIAAGMKTVGVSAAGGVGRATAELIVNGTTSLDMYELDVSRFIGLHNNREFLRDRSREVPSMHYALQYPHLEFTSGRNLRMSPIYPKLKEAGAVFGQVMGYERPSWFQPDDECDLNPVEGSQKYKIAYTNTFGKPPWFDAAAHEYAACRETVGLSDYSSFTKVDLWSKGTEVVDLLQYLCSNDVDVPVGSIIHTGMQNSRGGYENDCSLARIAVNHYMMIAPTIQQTRCKHWINRHLPSNGSVVLSDVTSAYTAICIMGPSTRPLLSELTDTDLSPKNFPFFTFKELDVGLANGIRTMNLTHTGELGYVLYIPNEFALHVYTRLIEAGGKYDLRHAGYYATRALRVEKFYAFWGQDLDTFTTPLECGRSWRVKFDKDIDFIGREALLRQREEGVKRKYVQLLLNDHDPDIDLWCWGGEPIYRNGHYCGMTTTTGYGFTFKKQVCLGFIQNLNDEGKEGEVTNEYVLSGDYEVDVAGIKYHAKCHLHSPNLPTKYPDKERDAYHATRDHLSTYVIEIEGSLAKLDVTMDPPDKPWDHPWTTDEMREHRDDWSLAADAGLLKHLQQFSDNLTERFKKTHEKLHSLSSELEEATVIIDNVTNTSLALANTQFIESRVHEDDSEIDKSNATKNSKDNKQDPYQDDLIACVSESIKEGLNIMNEKFERPEVLASDSEGDGKIPVPSVVLKPKDPYKNRPLPYVIGTEKWKKSNKGGLEASSSDSEPGDDDEGSASESANEIQKTASASNNRRDSLSRRSISPALSSLSGHNERFAAAAKDRSLGNDKLETHSQDTLNSGSEITTPSVAQSRAENTSRETPSFAEELAKRLGGVLPINKAVERNRDADQSSINRLKDDLFAPDGNDVFDSKTEDLFSDDKNLFDEEVSNSLWKNKPYKPPIANIIPPSLDVPPPMHAEAMKQKSAFDDLCSDSEFEDSDNIFAPKSTSKRSPSNSKATSDDKRESNESRENKFLNVLLGDNASNMATSTPEMNDNGGLFGDENDYEDDDALFGASVKSSSRMSQRSPELARVASRTMPPGLSITQADILSSNLGNRLFQRVPRQDSSDSSDNGSSTNNSNLPGNERIVPESDSSGISIRPNNNTINNTTNNTFGLGVDFQPESESTRLKSEEIYRERFPSDSLFDGRTRRPESTNSIDNSSLRVHDARMIVDTLDSAREEEDFEVDDVFGPPPLPKHNDSKSKSNDDLFSNSSSESRSHKSFDLLAASDSQYDVKITSERGGGLFDEEVDIFGDSDAPQIDIFGQAFKSPNFLSTDSTAQAIPKIQPDSSATSTGDNEDFPSRKINENPKITTGESKKLFVETPSIFDDSEDDSDTDDLFGGNFLKTSRKPNKIMSEPDEDVILPNKSNPMGSAAFNETKKDHAGPLARANVASETETMPEPAKRARDAPRDVVKSLPNNSSSGLFDNLDEEHDVFSGVATDRERAEENLFDGDETSKESSTVASKQKSQGETPREEISPLKNPHSTEKSSDEEEGATKTDGGTISMSCDSPENIGEIARRDPPKTLSIRLPIVSDDSSQAPPRRAVSGKIKNLMGKMGDLKILSPTDTPPLWRKSEEKVDSDSAKTESRDSEDGGSMSQPSDKSSIISAEKIDDSLPETVIKTVPGSPPDDSANSETAVSFDLPAQVEVLAVTASKSRAKIQVKRRPQSRHARQSALRKSAIDFDTVDNSGTEAVESDPSDNTLPCPASAPGDVEAFGPDDNSDARADIEIGKSSIDKTVESNSCLMPEDRSEMSLSKGSSLSLNKNTLLSPSTDEEDLFDVPPDLPEDPPKEDTLFGRAPILSPIDRSPKSKRSKDRSRGRGSSMAESRESSNSRDKIVDEKSRVENRLEAESTTIEPLDPLRDDSHDPLKDPSQLFAFVTKTPSPEKGQNVLFKEDASLFANLTKKTLEEAKSAPKKAPILDLFDDDSSGDLFSGALAISSKKSLKSTKNKGLFDSIDNTEDDITSDLFGDRSTSAREKSTKNDESLKSNVTSGRVSPISMFVDDVDDLFVDPSTKKVSPEPEVPITKDDTLLFPATSKITKDARKNRDLFGDQSSGDDDLFAKNPIVPSGKISGASGSLFSIDHDDDDPDDIFGTKTSTKTSKSETAENRSSLKKAVTRDLKKTAEPIVQDPLSMLQDE